MGEGPTHGELILKRLSPTNKTQSSDQPRSFRNRTEKRPALPQQHGGAGREQAGRLTKRVDMRLSRKRKPLRSICYVCDRSPSHARGSQDLATVGQSRLRRHRQDSPPQRQRSAWQSNVSAGTATRREAYQTERGPVIPPVDDGSSRSQIETVRRHGRDQRGRSEHDRLQ
jgi:hypothetical protein